MGRGYGLPTELTARQITPLLISTWLITALLLAALPAAGQQYHVRNYTVDQGLPSAHVRGITQDGEGRIWFATRSGVAAYDGFDWATYNLADGLTWADQFTLRHDDEGMLWSVGAISPFKIFYLFQDQWHERPGPQNIAADLRITAFAVQGSGPRATLVIGTDTGGLLIDDGTQWRRVTAGEGLPSDKVSGLVAREEQLIVATAAGLVALRDGQLDRALLEVLPASRREIHGLDLETADGATRLWIVGRDWIGQLVDGRWSLLAEDLPLGGRPGLPKAVAGDRRGGLYLGTSAAFFHFHPSAGLERIGRDNGILTDGVNTLYFDREDNLWIGTERGASKLVSRRLARYGKAQGLYADEVTAVLEQRDGTIVLGHRGGITFLAAEGIRTQPLVRPAETTSNRSLSRPERVSDLAQDDAGHLWLAAGDLGLAQLEPGAAPRW
ncbi:MAG: two-component regulator propeller domain-containing protein, partial [Acidobacteriota bacterium]